MIRLSQWHLSNYREVQNTDTQIITSVLSFQLVKIENYKYFIQNMFFYILEKLSGYRQAYTINIPAVPPPASCTTPVQYSLFCFECFY